jgi:hypothetical protein
MTLQGEGVVTRGMDREEALSGAGRYKALHFPFVSSPHLMGVLARLFLRKPRL